MVLLPVYLFNKKGNKIEKILLTCSGGPFRGFDSGALEKVTVEDALRHPNWNMGPKITVDSATLVNKGLEVIEAGWLFGVSADKIKVVVQPQSIIHSMVEYVDGAVMAQLGVPDMKLPIQYALFYPDRLPMQENKIDFFALGQITFEEPDPEVFIGLKLAYEAFEAGGSMPTVFNAANEKAVSLFLDRKIRFLEIPELIGASMEQHKVIANPTVEEILETEASCYEFIESRC
jgi:1-deoxy-D-xylulose-5-phosphate reductoisomerase